jgi:ribosome-associated protein
MNMPHRRAITKKEQADMGKLKKSVRGLVVVHPMTELGREMGLKEMTGFVRPRSDISPSPGERAGGGHQATRFKLAQPIFLPGSQFHYFRSQTIATITSG